MTFAAHAPVDAPATWLLSNHDVTRPVTRYGRADSSFAFLAKRQGIPTDVALGRRRARAAALLVAALPGSLYIYQGDELGLDEVEDLPGDRLQDPMHFRSGGIDPGRDGCRVPLPWSGATAPFGFSPPDATAEPWLPQPDRWADLTVEAQASRADSMLTLYRAALGLRRSDPDLRTERFAWLPSSPDALAFRRGDRFVAIANLGSTPVAAPRGGELLVSSHDLVDGCLPSDATAWWRLDGVGGDEP
jgi:alpha-glucosidase